MKVPGSGIEGVRSGEPRHADRLGWPVDDLSTPDFDWADGDDTSPVQGPTLSTIGTPVNRSATPWTGFDGNAVTCTSFTSADQYVATGTPVDPGATDDVVVLLLVNLINNSNNATWMATRDTGAGWEVFTTGSDIRFVSSDGSNFATSVSTTGNEGWHLFGVTFEDGVNQVVYVDGAAEDTDSVAAVGSLAGGSGISLNARISGGRRFSSCIARGLVWYGSGIAATADAAWHLAVAQQVVPDLV
jgi:hypothetical protein